MLDRCPDRMGMLLNMKMFTNGLHAKHVMLSLCNSEETHQKWQKSAANSDESVKLFHSACLNRTADAEEIATIKGMLTSPGYQAICSSLLNSAEYSNFWGLDHVPGGGRGKNCKHGMKNTVISFRW